MDHSDPSVNLYRASVYPCLCRLVLAAVVPLDELAAQLAEHREELFLEMRLVCCGPGMKRDMSETVVEVNKRQERK